MTEPLFREDAYLRDAPARVVDINDRGGVILDRTIFYPTGGGQPGDAGRLTWPGGECAIATAVKGEDDSVVLVPTEGAILPEIGTEVTQLLDWDQRYLHMRMHTALHLLTVAIPLPVTGGQIGASKSRLDFVMPEPPEDKAAVETALNDLIAQDLPVTQEWITETELDAQPDLVKTMSVQPPRGAGRIRLVRIGEGPATVDLQPCGGTHVARTGEIGQVAIGKIENKGKQNRRVNISLAG
jgi:misacylated tRNA(Ala) deacylase